MLSTKEVENQQRDEDEKKRDENRREGIKLLKPGNIVRVIERFVNAPNYVIGKKYKLNRIATWKQPNSDGIILSRKWKDHNSDPAFKAAFERAKGPTIHVNEKALVVAVLPEMPCALNGTRPWVLLLTTEGSFGWCYVIDALVLVRSP